MTGLRRVRSVIGKAMIAVGCAVFATALAAQQWPSLYADTPTSLDIEPGSLGRVPELQNVIAAWFRYTHPEMSAQCIPPPRACYAKAQRVYYRINCANGSLAQIQRMVIDLNGDVSWQSEPDF